MHALVSRDQTAIFMQGIYNPQLVVPCVKIVVWPHNTMHAPSFLTINVHRAADKVRAMAHEPIRVYLVKMLLACILRS